VLAEGAPAEHQKAKDDAALERQALLPRIPSVRVLVEGAQPSEVFVTVNGELVPAALVGAKRPVNPGKLAIKATRGADVVEAAVELREGETRDVRLVFAPRVAVAAVPPPGPAPAAPGPEPARPSDADGGATQRTLGWVALGVGGAGLAVGGIFGILGLSDKSELEASCPDRRCEPSEYDALDAYESKRTISTIGFVAGAAFAATGVVLLLTAPSGAASPSDAGARGKPRFGAFIGPNRVELFGAFE
jgi:hypothetical protein